MRDLAALESLLTQYKEKKAEEQRNTDKKLDAAKRQAAQKVREEMEEKLLQIQEQLDQERQKAARVQEPGNTYNISITIPLPEM